MSLANPWGLLALAAIPLILYLHRKRPSERRVVPLVDLWHPGTSGARQGARRYRVDPILLVRLLIVAGIALALARPGWPVHAPHRRILLLDASASMGAREEAGQRFQRTVAAAQRLLRQISPGEEVMVLRGGKPPTLVHAFTRDRRSLEAAMQSVTPGEAPKDLLAALTMARTALAGEAGTVDVFSDLRDPEALLRLGRRLGLSEDALRVHPVGGPADNLAIVRLDAAPLSSSPFDYEVFVEVGNFSGRPRTTELGLYLPDGLRETRRLALAPWERKALTMPAPLARWMEVRLEATGDALAVDDRATLMLPGPMRVLYVSRKDRFLDAALSVDPGLTIRRIPAEQLQREQWSSLSADVVVADGAVLSPDFPLPALVFAPAARGGKGTSRSVPVVEWQRRHPLLRQLDLSEVVVPAGAVVRSDAGGALIRSADGPVARVPLASGARRVEVAFPVDRANLGETPAFPILVARILEWLADRDTSSLAVQAGDPLHVRVPGARTGVLTVRRPDGSAVRIAPRDGYLDFRDTEQTGRYDVEGAGAPASFAVNLLDAEESNVDRRGGPAVDAALTRVTERTGWRDIERWVLAVALQLLSVEIWLLQRQASRGAR